MAMLDVINKMKGTALGVAEYLTPVLKVSSFFILKHIVAFGAWNTENMETVLLQFQFLTTRNSCNFFCWRTFAGDEL